MKEREKQILEWIINEHQVPINLLLDYFKISKRTLYYNLESINFYIKHCGQVKNTGGLLRYVGRYRSLQDILNAKDTLLVSAKDRVHYILYKILGESKITIESLQNEMGFSKNTIVQIFEDAKKELSDKGLRLQTKPGYSIIGDEYKIRNLYLTLMQEDNNLLNNVTPEALEFDRKYAINLTDYSLTGVSKFIGFIQERINRGHIIVKPPYFDESRSFQHYEGIQSLFKIYDENESAYLSAYIASCSSLNYDTNAGIIENVIDKLVFRFEAYTAISLERKHEFKQSMRRHLLSSYYRIKFRFPIYNPSLEEIKLKHAHLFSTIKGILENQEDFPDFAGIRDEEIGFITAYFGCYIKGSPLGENRKNKILLVCPNGLMISKSLEIQLYQTIPMIEIIDVIALKELKEHTKAYDYIVTTVELPEYDNVIVVNPMLTKLDIDRLMLKIGGVSTGAIIHDIESIIRIVRQNAFIQDEAKLKRELLKLLYRNSEKELVQPMLKELINEQRVQKIQRMEDWKDAISFAAKPLLDDGSIEQSYVDAMINAVIEYGPYIVLADGFALPHASAKGGVNQLSMALLVVDDAVDLLGKPVNLFMVLATKDNTSHIKALSSLTELLYDEKNMAIFKSGNKADIIELINNQNNRNEDGKL